MPIETVICWQYFNGAALKNWDWCNIRGRLLQAAGAAYETARQYTVAVGQINKPSEEKNTQAESRALLLTFSTNPEL